MPASLGNYQLVEVIARGGMGVVYRARLASSNQEIALKVLHCGVAISPEARQRFHYEIKTTCALSHPGILPVYDHGEIDGTPFFSMRMASGGSLCERMPEFACQWQRIANFMARVSDIVHFAHEQGVLHRDLKPANILLDDMGNPFVCDFGIAKVTGFDPNLTLPQTQVGTPHYMSPEMVKQEKAALAPASDVWSLGVVLYEMLAGQRPFQGTSPAHVMRQVEVMEPKWLPEVPRDLAFIVFKALAKNPTRRYRSALELSNDLRRWLNGEPVHAKSPRLADRVKSWMTRCGAAFLLSMMASLLVTVAPALGCRQT